MVIAELLTNRKYTKYIFTGYYLLLYMLLPYLAARYWFIITIDDAYLYSIPYTYYFEPFLFEPSLLLYSVYLTLIAIIPVAYIIDLYLHAKVESLFQPIPFIYRYGVQTILILVFFSLSYYLNFDETLKLKLKIEYYADQERWEEIIQESQLLEGTEIERENIFHVDRALCHLGSLLDNLFQYNQKYGVDGLFLTKFIGSQIAIQSSDLYFDLGHITASRVMAYEGFTKYKYHPKIIQRLAITNIIQGDIEAAKKFILLLKGSIIYKASAQEYENYIREPVKIRKGSLIYDKRLLAVTDDFFINNKLPRIDLQNLVETNNRNRTAIDYLFAYYLLEGNINAIYDNLHYLNDVGYTKVPLHVQEAVLMYGMRNKIEPKVLVQTCDIDENAFKDYIRFVLVLRENLNDDVKAQKILESQFGKTYWYYLRYLHPKITGLELKSRYKDVDMYKLY